MFLFSQPPPFRSRRTSISSEFLHCWTWTVGVPGPRLSPLFVPVRESTEFGRSLPRFVASAIALWIADSMRIWSAPTGVLTRNVGQPVSWQIGPSQSLAMSMLVAMT